MSEVNLRKPEEFFKRVDEYRETRDMSYLKAYRLTERDFRKTFEGDRKYSSYYSFKKCYNRRNE